jgi:hypothetical protein
MKKLGFILASILIGFTGFSQDPDQNPNYKISAEKYAEIADEINKTQGQTIQDTYTAFDWSTYKAEKKQARIDSRLDRRKMRYQYYRPYGYNYTPYNGNNNYNGYNNNGYYNTNPYSNTYYPNYYGGCNTLNGLTNSLLLGATLYSIFH